MNDPGYEPKTARPETVRAQVATYSAAVDKMAGLPRGDRKPHGPLIALNARGVERGFYMSDVWSVQTSEVRDVADGYDRLRKALPAAGWKIVGEKNGTSQGGGPELHAEHEADHFTLTVELIRERRLLYLNLDSVVFVAPADVDLNTQH